MSALREAAQQALEALEYDGLLKKRQAIAALRAALAQEQAEPDAYPYASRLAASIWERHYKGEAPNWKPLDDLMGVLTQIDNMATGLTRQGQEQAEPVAWLQPKTVNAYSRPDLGYESCSSADYGAFPVYRALPRCPNCASLEAQNDELDRKLAEMERAEPVAVVGTQVDVWRGCDGRWAPPGEPIKTALMLKDAPVGTMLYAAPPKRQPLSGLEVERLLEQVIGSLPAARNLVRAVERAHGIIESEIRGDSHQTLDDAMQQPRAMAQAYESGYNAGVANEREACAKLCEARFVGDLNREDMEARRCAAAIRARGNT